MAVTEEEYNPIEVEAAIDDAYGMAEQLDEYEQEITEIIEEFEDMPYSVNRDGSFEQDEMVNALNALSSLENYSWETRSNYPTPPNVEESQIIRQIETLLTEEAFKPARREGKML